MTTCVAERASLSKSVDEAMVGAQTGEALSRRVRELAAQLAAARSAQGEFVSVISHELRTPLNAMIGFSELLLGTPQSVQQRKWLGNIHQCGCNLVDLINDMADFSKIASGAVELAQADFALPKVVEEAVETIRSEAEMRGISMRTVLDPGLACRLIGDGPRVKQILVSLLTHAVRFSRAGEEIALTIARHVADLSDLSASADLGHLASGRRPPSTHILFAVKDAGAGIPPDQLGAIFEPFKQLKIPDGKSGGTGLKLAICRQLVAKMGGDIWVESEQGRGSVFTFVIPCGQAESSSVE